VPWYGCKYCCTVPVCIYSPTKVCDAPFLFINYIESARGVQFIYASKEWWPLIYRRTNVECLIESNWFDSALVALNYWLAATSAETLSITDRLR